MVVPPLHAMRYQMDSEVSKALAPLPGIDTAERLGSFGYGGEVLGGVMAVLGRAVKVWVTLVWLGRGLESVGDGGGI